MAVNDPKTAVDKFFMLQMSQDGTQLPLRREVDWSGVSFTDDPVNQKLLASVSGSSPVNGQNNVTLTNGLNSNIATLDHPIVRAGGPTAAFSVGGFAPGTSWRGGQRVVFINTTDQVCTLVHEDTSSTNTNRLSLPHSKPITLLPRSAGIEFAWDSTISRFVPLHTGFRYDSVINAKDFGATGDGSTDDSAALDAATAAAFAQRKPLYLPAGVYIRNTPWVIFPPSPFVPFRMFGDGGAQAGQAHTTVRAGPSFPPKGVLVTVGDPSTFLNNAEFTHISFDANQIAIYACWVRRFTDATMFRNCGFLLPYSAPYWLPNTAYTTSSPLVIPWEDNGHLYKCTTGGTSTNATNAPGSGGGTRSPVFNTGSGSTTNDNGVVWTEQGPSGACLVIGDDGEEADLVLIEKCIFNGPGGIVPGSPLNPTQTVITGTCTGLRFNGNGNVKDFCISESFWTDCGRGFDFTGADGQLTVKFCGGGSTECDFFIPGSVSAVITGTSSEGSACVLKGAVGASTAYTPVTIISGFWNYAGGVFAQGPTFGCAVFGNFNLNLQGCTVIDTGGISLNTTLAADFTQPSPGFSVNIQVTGGLTSGTNAAFVGQRIHIVGGGYYKISAIADDTHCTIIELNEAGNSGGAAGGNTVAHPAAVQNAQFGKIAGCVGTGVAFTYFGNSNSFFNATRLPLFDTGFGLAAVNGDPSSFVGLINGNGGTFIVSQNEGGTSPVDGTPILFGNYSGTPFRPGSQQYLEQIGQTIDAGVVVKERGRLVTMQRRITVPYTALIAAATTQRLSLGDIWPDYRILAIYAKVTTGFSTIGGMDLTMQVGRFQVTPIIHTDNAYLLAHDVASPVVIGTSGGDLGADLATVVQGAAAYFGDDYPSATSDELTCLFTSPGGNLGTGHVTNLAAGSVDIIVIYQKL